MAQKNYLTFNLINQLSHIEIYYRNLLMGKNYQWLVLQQTNLSYRIIYFSFDNATTPYVTRLHAIYSTAKVDLIINLHIMTTCRTYGIGYTIKKV